MAKKTNKKKNGRNEFAEMVAPTLKCTPAYVRMVVNGAREDNSDKAKAIKQAYDAYLLRNNELLSAVKKMVKL